MAKRKSKTIIMDGYVKWARRTLADMDTKFDPRGNFTCRVLSRNSRRARKALDEAEARGKDLTVKDPHDGEGYGIGKFIKIVRNNVNNTIEELGGPPEVVRLDEDGNMEPWSFDEDGLVGNGSKVRVKLDFYGEGRFAGSRLAKIGVMEHVPYAPEAKASGF